VQPRRPLLVAVAVADECLVLEVCRHGTFAW
jgi:hypothetical protein